MKSRGSLLRPRNRFSTISERSISSKIVFTGKAEADLAGIFEWTCERFGGDQARNYIDGLESALDRLLSFPESAPRYAGSERRYRVKRYRSHRIYFRSEGRNIVIVRILHVRQDAPSKLA